MAATFLRARFADLAPTHCPACDRELASCRCANLARLEAERRSLIHRWRQLVELERALRRRRDAVFGPESAPLPFYARGPHIQRRDRLEQLRRRATRAANRLTDRIQVLRAELDELRESEAWPTPSTLRRETHDADESKVR